MAFLVDTSVLVRLANRAEASYSVAGGAVVELHRRGETLHLTPQNLVEFRSVATRPAAETKAADFERLFALLPETPDIYPAWKALVAMAGVIGKQGHDARLVAVCQVHRISQLLTFNTAHFAVLTGFGPGIVVVHPASV